MITNRDIEIAFVRAQNRINEELDNAQAEFMLPDIIEATGAMYGAFEKNNRINNMNFQELTNPLANEEI